MSERENVIDFTVPFHEPVGLTILMKKSKFEYSLHKFLSVLSIEVWGCIVASYFLFSILMWLFDRFSPYSYQNNPGTAKGPEKRVFTFKEGIWFCMTSLTPQGMNMNSFFIWVWSPCDNLHDLSYEINCVIFLRNVNEQVFCTCNNLKNEMKMSSYTQTNASLFSLFHILSDSCNAHGIQKQAGQNSFTRSSMFFMT